MATNIDIYNSSYYLQLYNTPYKVLPGTLLPPPAQRAFSTAARSRMQSLLSVQRDNKVVELPIEIQGDTMDDWLINAQQIQTILRDAELWNDPQNAQQSGDRAWFSVQLFAGSNTTEWEILCGELITEKLLHIHMSRTAPKLPSAVLRLWVHKWGAPQQVTRVISSTITNGASQYVLSAPTGEREAPCKIVMQTSAGDTWRRMLLSRRTKGNVNNLVWLFECETTGGTGYAITDIETSGQIALSNVVNAAASGGNVLRVAHTAGAADTLADIIRVTINTKLADFYGDYHVFLKTQAANNNWTAVRMKWGGPNGDAITGDTVTATFAALDGIYLGTLSIPYPYAPDGVSVPSFAFTLQMTLANATFNVDLDCIYLVAADEQYAEIELSAAATTAQDQQVFDNLSPTPVTYLLDSAGDLQSDLWLGGSRDARFTVIPGKDNLFQCLYADGAASGARRFLNIDLTDTYTLEFWYLPQYELLR